jgi:NADH-quinone oxidoreductase subunit C
MTHDSGLTILPMTNDELKSSLGSLLPAPSFEEGGEWVNMQIAPQDWWPLAQQLRNNNHLYFDYLFCLTCVDWKTHLTMVYHLSSTKHRHNIVVKAKLDRNNAIIESCCNLWKTAEFHEREVAELFGVHFSNHPDLRKLILPDDWVGYPLRKDYEDPVNMIKL